MNPKFALVMCLLVFSAVLTGAQQAPFSGAVTSVTAPVSGNLASFLKERANASLKGGEAVWIGYQVPVRDKFSGVSSSSFHHGSWSGMSINGWHIESDNSGIEREGARDKALLLRFERRSEALAIRDIAIAELDEPLRFTIPLIWIDGVSADRSLDCLVALIKDPTGSRQNDDLAAAIAIHEGERPVTILKDLLFSLPDRSAREDVLTWLGLMLAPERMTEIYALENRLTDSDLRESLTFIYYRADSDEATKRLFALAKNDADEDVREQALFWLGQKARTKLGGGSEETLADDQKSALFALRHRDSAASRKALLNVARTGKTPELRGTALFWLCQEGDPIVISYLEELLLGTAARR